MNKCKLFVVISLFAQCAFASLPNWVTNPPSDDSMEMYSVGEGDSMKSAIDDALNTLASKLSVSVSSTLSRSESQSTFGTSMSYNKNVKNEIKSEVKKISFNNVDHMFNAIENGRTYVLVRVDKAKFISEKKDEIKMIESEMVKKAERSVGLDIVDRFTLLKEVISLGKNSENLVNIVSSLGEYNKQDHFALYDKYKTEFSKVMNEVSAFVSSNSEGKVFGDVIREELVATKIKTAKSYKVGRNSILIDLDAKPIVKQLYGRYMAKVKVTINLKNGDDDVVYSASVECQGNSSVDEQSAVNAAGNDFAAKVKEKGILKLLGFDPQI